MNRPLRHHIGGYREYDPAPGAAFFAEAFWTHHAAAGEVADGAAHRVLPDPAVSVGYNVRRTAEGVPVSGAILLIGPKSRPHVFPVVPGLELTAVRLKLEWVAPILGIDPGGLDNKMLELSAVRPDLTDRLASRLWRTGSAREVLAILAGTLLESRASRLSPAPAATAALELVRQTSGLVPCRRVAARVGVSMRHLRRQVHDAAGLSPKTYARVLRLAHVMQLADRSPRPDWADIAVRAGFYDQSHLIRDCLALGGAAPAQLHAERGRQRIAGPDADGCPTQRPLAEKSNPG